ncbi:stage III sporulation protein AF [Desulforamulus ferrireducens]|uniref:Stage III sporulation protein AF n=1 Tax=Desulforamulus ferrireducens TaxID=1833852 RepID=A0A1S6IUP6_9FIRM|nr:stage III sporulation protein AF [Desulforamulus ferrireducens]AQS58496.1 stage III sporulation protein AF [Desulforamulus ferrireducens]
MEGLESIKALVQVLVIIIVMAVLIEMLLPSSSMHDYVKMVMGLLVIVVVLEAGANLVKQDFKFELPALQQSSSGPSLETILGEGERLAGKNKEQALAEYRQGLEKQVLALAKLQNDLNVTGARIKTAGQPGDPEFGRLTGVVLEISEAQAENEQLVDRIKPVEITVGTNNSVEDTANNALVHSEQARKLAQTVANFYNIPVEQVQVVQVKQ